MTEEEKKAIEIVKGLAVYYDDYSLLDEEEIEENESVNKSIELILTLIEKLLKENEKLNNRCRNLDKEAQAYLEELAGDNTLTRRTIKQLQEENEELNEKILDNAGIYQLGFKDGEESYIKKVKDKIRKNEEIIDISNDGDLIHELYQKNKVYEELLESEK